MLKDIPEPANGTVPDQAFLTDAGVPEACATCMLANMEKDAFMLACTTAVEAGSCTADEIKEFMTPLMAKGERRLQLSRFRRLDAHGDKGDDEGMPDMSMLSEACGSCMLSQMG